MKTFKSFVTKRTLTEGVPSKSKIDSFNKILFITLTQGELELDSSRYKYFLGELEDNGFELNLTMLDNFVGWFSAKFKNVFKRTDIHVKPSLSKSRDVFTWSGKPIQTPLKLLSHNEKGLVETNTKYLLTAIDTTWTRIKVSDATLKKEDPTGNYIIVNKSFSEAAIEVLECTDEESDIARYFTAAY